MSRRYTLRNPKIFKEIMEHPGTGVPYSYRTLADAAGCSHSLIEGLVAGRQKTVSVDDAHSLAERLGVAVLVLFAPRATPNQDDLATKIPPTP
jgi:transcriptional regulator with XRE-family HTH domain